MLSTETTSENPRRAAHAGCIVFEAEKNQVIECAECGFKHLEPIPSPKELEDFYRESYYSTHKPGYIQEETDEKDFQRIAFSERLSFFNANAKGRTLLDIGCGAGAFLSYAAAHGWRVHGVEPSSMAAETARAAGLDVTHSTLDDFSPGPGVKYDVVHLKNVLEHVRDPASVLKRCAELLVPGGLLYVEVPNDFEPVQKIGVRIAKEKPSWVCIPDHINYFNFKSMQNLLTRSGFTVLKRDTTFPIYLFLWIGMNFIRSKEAGKTAHKFRVKFEMLLWKVRLNWLKRAWYGLLAMLGTGRTVIMYSKVDK